MSKPTSKPAWAQGNPSLSTIAVEPSGTKKLNAWAQQEPPGFDHVNWLFNNISNWLDWLDGLIVTVSTATYAVPTTNRKLVLLVSATANNVVLNLPAATSSIAGMQILIKRIDTASYLASVAPNGTDNIEFANTSRYLDFQGATIELTCDGTAWYVTPSHWSKNSFTLANNQVAAANVTGLYLDPTRYRSVLIRYDIVRKTATVGSECREIGYLLFVYSSEDAAWSIGYMGAPTQLKNDPNVTFSMSGNQVQYVTSNIAGTSYVGTMNYRVVEAF